MANDITAIENYMPRVVDRVFVEKSLTERLMGGNAVKLDFIDKKTCKIFKVAETALRNYARGGSGSSNARGAVQSSVEVFTLGQERYSEIPVDSIDTLDDGATVLGHLSERYIEEKVVAEFDAYRLSKLAGYTSLTLGNRVSENISANTIISKFNAAFEWMSEHEVPTENQVLYVSPAVMTLIRNSNELVHYLRQEDYKNGNVTFTINKYQGREIVEVPSSRFFTDIVIGDGYAPSSSSKVINFLLVDKSAPIIVKKLDFAKIYDSENGGAYIGFVGKLIANLYYHDLFVPENKQIAIYCSVSTTDGANVCGALSINAKAGTTQGKTIITQVYTKPAGILWDKLYQATAASKPAIGSSTAALTEITLGAEFTPNASHNYIVASYDGKAVAVSKDWEDDLPVGA